MANSRFYSSIAAATNLQVTASPSDTSIQVASSVGWPSSFPFIVSLDYGAANEELVLVNSGGPSVFNVTRAYDGTSATTHNAGAVVRHVSSAIDFTDSRTHEASSTGVHGISGTFVDTISSQTLANKTLNTSILNSPNISGTVTGLPTFGGVVTFNNGIVVQGSSGSSVAATGTTTAWRARVTGDAIDRWAVRGDGQVQWGDGTLARDTNLYRSSANTLATDDAFIALGGVAAQRPVSTNPALQANVTGDTQPRLQANASGALNWGSGTAATDTNLYRSAAATLKTDNDFVVNGDITTTASVHTGNLDITGQLWTNFTPVWAGLGSGTFTQNIGWYTKYGKVVFFEIYMVMNAAGTGSGSVSVQFPTEPFRAGAGANTTRQAIQGLITLSNGGVIDGVCTMPAFAGDTGTTGATIRRFDGITTQGSNFASGCIVTIQGWYREV